MATHSIEQAMIRVLTLSLLLVLAVQIAMAQPSKPQLPPLKSQHISESRLLISDLRLSNNLTDMVTGESALFSRPSVAYSIEGDLVPEGSPRFEQFAAAVGYEWVLPEVTNDEFAPIAITGGKLIAQDWFRNVYVSTDGENFDITGTYPHWIWCASASGTPEGALLIATGNPYDPTSERGIWRTEDDGQTWTRVLVMRVGGPANWNWVTLGNSLFVSEYGKYSLDGDGNARQIYRSDDDGRSWELVYDEPPQETRHCHLLLADPWGGCLYQYWGDADEQVIRSCDGGDTWEWIHDYYQPIAGIAREEGIYTGHEGIGKPGVTRYERDTGLSKHVWSPWFAVDGDECIRGMFEHEGVIYVPNSMHRQAMWASADGDHWTLLHEPFGQHDDIGILKTVGYFGEWIHIHYILGDSSPHPRGHLKFRPGRLATIGGIRIEAPAENLLGSEQASSAESGLEGWVGMGNTTLTWDTSRSFHGSASIRVDSPDANPFVLCPPLPDSVPVGTFLQGQIHLIGDERTLKIRLYDQPNGHCANYYSGCPYDYWTPNSCCMTVTEPDNRVRLTIAHLQTLYYPRPITFWIDGYQITEAQTGRTWVVGGVPRAGEILRHNVPFGAEWTDFLCFNPEFNNVEGDDRQRTIKAWVEDLDNYVRLIFDPDDQMFKLIEVVAAMPQVLCETGPVEFQPGWVHRIALRSATDACELRLRIGTAINYSASGPPLNIQPTELWIGSSPAGDDQAPGLYALSRTFNGALNRVALERELAFLPQAGAP